MPSILMDGKDIMHKGKNYCPHFGKCGGCNFLNLQYENELSQKKLAVENALAECEIDAPVSDVVPMFFPYKYRNNIHLAVEQQAHRTVVGFYSQGGKNLIDIQNCLLFDSWAQKLITIVKKYIRSFKISGFNPITRAGILRYVVARNFGNDIIVTLVVTTQNFAGKKEFYDMLKQEFGNVSLWLNINKRTDSAVFDKTFIHKFGDKKLNANLCGINFALSPSSFVQTNFQIAGKMYQKALEYIKDSGCNAVIDLFSGIGITSCIFAKNGFDVLSVEMQKSSVLDAVEIQKKNNVEGKILAYCGKCEDLTTEMLDWSKNRNVAVFVDPAKNGIMPNV
ncbi:MAG: class I SAM-dependent RNA methyltransferase, partial [Clostridia bacterium]|nr:class I SAM-dependent RNA methyltransferase [Clostridia bacterium]